jgi:3-oxoacyl-[acyl-carrier protein] reductase
MTESSPLGGLAVLVTGASGGIGRAIALGVAGAGADVALTYRENEDGARETERAIQRLGRRGVRIPLDLADEASIRKVGPAASAALGRLDVWVNNAGADILTGSNASMSDIERLDLLLSVDLRGTILASWQAVDLFRARQGGVIINMSWDHVLTGMSGTNPQLFSAVKGGVLAFSKSLARTSAPLVRVNVVAPGWIETSFGTHLDRETRRAVEESTPLGRWGRPEDVAGAVVYLASPAASFLTGQTLIVGGGVVMA